MIQTLSLEMSQHLSSLVPGFEGHYWYLKEEPSRQTIGINCEWRMDCVTDLKGGSYGKDKICPAWQVEDVLRNLKEILPDPTPFQRLGFAEHLGRLLLSPSDTAYQKIEEYLWTILK